jgi:serine/threonine protein kinase
MDPRDAANRDLLLGMLALQTGMIDQGCLVAAFQAWTLDRRRPLAVHLQARGDLDDDDRAALEVLVLRHLRKHGDDAGRSLAAVSAPASIVASLAGLGDIDVDASLGHIQQSRPISTVRGATPSETATMSFGGAASDGLRFRLLRPHARGGLGEVFVALDAELNREVALKQILAHHADDPTSRTRFVLEAEITGGLEHPGIVPVYGLGSYADGRPFYAMRFIRGDSLKEAVDHFHADEALKSDPGRRSLELRKLLRRFTDVCNAIDYAHSRGVLHRDIKPGNIVVGKHGETLVVDWGLAKSTGQSDPSSGERTLVPSSASGSAETLPGSALGTPAYMSPEQAEGDLDRLGPRSDVYSLGATLYCLLTGAPPFAGDAVDVIPRVRRGEFRPPRAVDPAIDLALEAVCLKAMALRPENRYASPKALAEDVERWMADEPVTAIREPASVRLARWARRHRPQVAGAAALLIASVVGLTAGTVLLGRAKARIEEQRLRAEANFNKAREAVDEYFTKVSASKLLNVPGLQPLRKELLESAREYHREFLRERSDDPTVRAEAAESWYRLGMITNEIGSQTEALEHLQKSAALYEALTRDHPDEVRYPYKLAMCLNDIGRQHHELGSASESLKALERGIALREEVVRRASMVPEYQKELAIGYANIGNLYGNQGQPERALASLRKARGLYEQLIRDHPDVADYRSRLIYVDMVLSQTQADVGQVEEGLESLRRALAAAERLVREHPAELAYADRLVWCLWGLGQMQLREAGRPEEALTVYRRLLDLAERLGRENPSAHLYRQHRVEALARIGQIEARLGRANVARPALERACDFGQEYLRDDPTNPWVQQGLAYASLALGRLRREAGSDAEAGELLRRAYGLSERLTANGAMTRYEHAAFHALCADLAARISTRPAEEDLDRGRRHAEQAVAALREAVAGGFRNAAVLESDPDLGAIRSRDDFQSVLRGLKEKTRGEVAPQNDQTRANQRLESRPTTADAR